MKSRYIHTQITEIERRRKEFHAAERHLVRAERELEELREEIAEFERSYVERMKERLAELEALEREIRKLPVTDADKGSAERTSSRRQSRVLLGDDADEEMLVQRPHRREENLKELYRRVAKTIHPDLSLQDSERKRRQKLMADANRAYAEEDMATLLCILDEWENLSEEDIPPSEESVLAMRTSRVRERIREVEAEILGLRKSDVYTLLRQVKQGKAQGQEVLSHMAAKIEADILAACRKLNHAARRREAIQCPEGVRSMLFPFLSPMGSVFVRTAGSRSFLDWRRLGDAVGRVTLPADKSVRLDVVPGRAADLHAVECVPATGLNACFLYGACDGDVPHLLKFKGLEEVYLSGSDISGDGLIHLLELTKLERLYLYDSGVDQEGVQCLKYLKMLKHLTISNGPAGNLSVAELQKLLPSCSIINLTLQRQAAPAVAKS
ncbi:hypothetical protein [Geobacter sp. DSM 9736]|uniref:hypothetical protein n=1 Tax=Geobacter sp. DSM 9736 TaxID=1277350 RepID=UPI000B4FEF5B|nr:hypothetical protein [Geobacter sp. DSM 9736]SNB45303.1 hypothetical protein SAMN06269301_0710 [Geobacter sp. DSM 9736]